MGVLMKAHGMVLSAHSEGYIFANIDRILKRNTLNGL